MQLAAYRRMSLGSRPGAGAYPLQRRALWLGLGFGIAFGVIFFSPTAGLAAATLIWLIGLLWRGDSIPVLSFCFAYQWIFASTGYFFMQFFGRYPGDLELGGIERAVAYSQLGLLAFALGIRAGLLGMDFRPNRDEGGINIRALFWLVLGLFSINWLIEIAPWELTVRGEEIVFNLLKIRYLFLFALFYAVARSGRGFRYAGLAMLYVMIPEVLSGFSRFKELIFLLAIALAGQWVMAPQNREQNMRNRRILASVAVLGVLLLALGILWSGALKRDWRLILWEGGMVGSPVEKVQQFGSVLETAVQDLDVVEGAEALGQRLSSGVTYFSLALQNVPAALPHERGALAWRAFEHVLTPRIFFPDKPVLASDSDLLRRYAGINAAGVESGTSIGMTYIAEFYIDFGFPLMLGGVFAFGLIVGLLYRTLRRIAPSEVLFNGAMAVLFTQHLMSYEGSLPKLLGGLLQLFLLLALVLFVIGKLNLGGLRGRFKPAAWSSV